MIISVQQEDFDAATITQQLCNQRKDIGAVVHFWGLVRDQSEDENLIALELEHYPGMTEKALSDIAQKATQLWDIIDIAIVHRVGRLLPSDNIVLVVVVSAHRTQAFQACEFIMDYLKTRAPFWKKEISTHGEQWVEARQSDQAKADEWK